MKAKDISLVLRASDALKAAEVEIPIFMMKS